MILNYLKMTKVILLLCASCLLSQTDFHKTKYDLKYKMKVGKEFTFISLGYSNSYTSSNDTMKLVLQRSRELVQEYKVLSSDDDKTSFELVYKKMVFSEKDGNGKLSTNEFTPLIGKKVRYTLSSKGYLNNYEYFDELPTIPTSTRPYTSEMFKDELTHMFPVFPSKPVYAGEKWSHKLMGYNIEYQILNEMKFNGYDCVRIQANMNLEKNAAVVKDANGNDINQKTTAPYSDIYYFAYKEGMILYRFSVQSFREAIFTSMDGQYLRKTSGNQLFEEHVILK